MLDLMDFADLSDCVSVEGKSNKPGGWRGFFWCVRAAAGEDWVERIWTGVWPLIWRLAVFADGFRGFQRVQRWFRVILQRKRQIIK
ncbi:MAG: hypothetical protein ACKPJD_07665, partial [Planctomycetaceae bacterium]